MPKLRMIVFNNDGSVRGSKDFMVQESAIRDDPLIDCMRVAMRDQVFIKDFELVLNNRRSLVSRLVELVEAIRPIEEDSYAGPVRRLDLSGAKAAISEASFIDTKVLSLRAQREDPPRDLKDVILENL